MNEGTVNLYARMADKSERDPYGPDGGGRATVVNGRGFQLHKRFNPNAEYVSVETLDGKMVELTRKQADVLDLVRQYIDSHTTYRELADQLHCAPSTIYRALVKLASYGLIGYLTARGRHHGTIIFRRGKNDGLGRFQKVAQDKVRKWSAATAARFSRLRDLVASNYSMKEIGGRGRVTDFYTSSTSLVATLSLPWTAEDVAGVE